MLRELCQLISLIAIRCGSGVPGFPPGGLRPRPLHSLPALWESLPLSDSQSFAGPAPLEKTRHALAQAPTQRCAGSAARRLRSGRRTAGAPKRALPKSRLPAAARRRARPSFSAPRRQALTRAKGGRGGEKEKASHYQPACRPLLFSFGLPRRTERCASHPTSSRDCRASQLRAPHLVPEAPHWRS